MCDKEHYNELRERVDELEIQFVRHSASSEVQISNLLKASTRLFWTAVIGGLLMLLTLIYGAIGERGFNHVSCAAKEMMQTP